MNKFCHSAAYLSNMAFYLYVYVSEYCITDHAEVIRIFQLLCCVTDQLLMGTK